MLLMVFLLFLLLLSNCLTKLLAQWAGNKVNLSPTQDGTLLGLAIITPLFLMACGVFVISWGEGNIDPTKFEALGSPNHSIWQKC